MVNEKSLYLILSALDLLILICPCLIITYVGTQSVPVFIQIIISLQLNETKEMFFFFPKMI